VLCLLWSLSFGGLHSLAWAVGPEFASGTETPAPLHPVASPGQESGSQGGLVTLTPEQLEIVRSAFKRASETRLSLNLEEEYYVGRAVAVQVLSSYKPYDCSILNAYLNNLGQGLALFSSRPELYNGYRFLVLDSEEINAFASPGGHIMVTRGLIRLTNSEDELAAVLAHEIAHVALRHGLSAIEGLRLTDIISEAAIDAGLASGGKVADFTAAFGDVIAGLAKQIITSGYSQACEIQADSEARRIIAEAGYDPQALERLIGRLPEREAGEQSGFAATHPSPQTRIGALSLSHVRDRRISGKPRIFLWDDEHMASEHFWQRQKLEAAWMENLAPVTVVRDERYRAVRGYF